MHLYAGRQIHRSALPIQWTTIRSSDEMHPMVETNEARPRGNKLLNAVAERTSGAYGGVHGGLLRSKILGANAGGDELVEWWYCGAESCCDWWVVLIAWS